MIETYRGVVFPWLADQMGHLTTSRYVEMFDVAAYHLAHRLGLGPDRTGRFGLADVRQEIDYKVEVPVGALVLIRSGILSSGRSSYRARHMMTSPDRRDTHAVLEAVTVRFDLIQRKSAPLPPDFADRAAEVAVERTA